MSNEDKSGNGDYHTGRIKFWGETIGLYPFKLRMKQARIAIKGEEDVPPARYDTSSLKQLRPLIGIPLWLGKQRVKNKVIITNCFNHTQTPIEKGWSVRVTQTRDFRGKNLTYDSHNGTDFSVPIGTELLAAAPGKVIRVLSEFNRGGLKVYIDHGEGLITCWAHLARAKVKEGDLVERGQVIAITGYSGLDSLITFPFGTPHTHFNVWLNGEPVDPFAHDGKPPLWRAGEMPTPYKGETLEETFTPSNFIDEKVKGVLSACLTQSTREKLERYENIYERASHTICEMNYYPTRFPVKENMYDKVYERKPVLDLPFHANEFDGIVFADEL
jgi:murein DD-endopeptidase